MFKSLLAAAALLLSATEHSEAACRPANQIRPVNLDFAQLAKKKLHIVYASENEYSASIDSAHMDLTATGNHTYNVTISVLKKDGKTEYKEFTTEYRGGVMTETYREWGLSATGMSYILDTTEDGGILWYRCSDSEYISNEEDLRQIVVPNGTTLSNDRVKQLMETDTSYNFRGNFIKLPH